MPTYEYICRACGHEFEAFQSITAATLRKCPSCGKSKLERKIGIGAGVLFKGGGFYETDYRSESYKKGHEAEKKASEAKSDSKTDSKTDASKKDAKSMTKSDSTTSDSKSSSAPTPSASKDATKSEPSKATHPSRVGRGMGNIVRGGKPKAARRSRKG
jgi:putative FmdB family regulatory protein